MRPNSTDLKINFLNFPANCGIGIYNTVSSKDASDSNKDTEVNREKIAAFCTECKQGHRKVTGTDSEGNMVVDFVARCDPIENC